MMKQQVLQQLSRHQPPFLSISLDTSRTSGVTERATELRWRALVEKLRAPWLPAPVREQIAETVLRPAPRSGPSGRYVVASADGVALDLVLPEPPVRDEIVVGPAPHLLPLIRATRQRPSYVLVVVDRAGADIDFVVGVGAEAWHRTITGSNDELHKVKSGLLSQRRVQARAEDSWDRNAAEVAKEVDAIVREYRPALVLVAGDQTAVAALQGAIGEGTRTLVRRLPTGTRADGASAAALDAAVKVEQDRYEAARRALVLDRFNSAEARQTAAVQGVEDVVTALGRSQVEHLLLHDDPLSTFAVWAGPGPEHISSSAQGLQAAGVTDPVRVRADAAIVWSAVAGGGEVTLLADTDRTLTNGIGAVLRWSDPSTSRDRVPSMPGHGEAFEDG
ncbi:hypothetical protein D1871_10680 [Nakamurella silvestris]|nr:hypothetical protein D1871_10680 [Nakamurella silvestris]